MLAVITDGQDGRGNERGNENNKDQIDKQKAQIFS